MYFWEMWGWWVGVSTGNIIVAFFGGGGSVGGYP